jgi:hypothetical protein
MPPVEEDFSNPVTLPVSIARPVTPNNYFRASVPRWLNNLMLNPEALSPVYAPVSKTRFDPYAKQVAEAIAQKAGVEVIVSKDYIPGLYSFLHSSKLTPVLGLETLARSMPPCPVLSVEDVLESLAPADHHDVGVFEILQMLQDDLPAARWQGCLERFPWVKTALV